MSFTDCVREYIVGFGGARFVQHKKVTWRTYVDRSRKDGITDKIVINFEYSTANGTRIYKPILERYASGHIVLYSRILYERFRHSYYSMSNKVQDVLDKYCTRLDNVRVDTIEQSSYYVPQVYVLKATYAPKCIQDSLEGSNGFGQFLAMANEEV
jgi:hypothetical protein